MSWCRHLWRGSRSCPSTGLKIRTDGWQSSCCRNPETHPGWKLQSGTKSEPAACLSYVHVKYVSLFCVCRVVFLRTTAEGADEGSETKVRCLYCALLPAMRESRVFAHSTPVCLVSLCSLPKVMPARHDSQCVAVAWSVLCSWCVRP